MNAQRDELAADISRSAREIDECLDIGHESTELADKLLAAGWSKPRTVNSIEDLEALKSGTVLRFPDGEIGMIMVAHDKRHVIGYPGILPTAELADASRHCFGDGLTVLFTPGGEG
ncbi:hypothetical protein [Rhodococcus globerulus]|uniref:Uncharacterized protein n=1 Tax=Rhodococcus globerulus TaxID=33008 RepID=A0ABU4BSL3_RHOGO|nr:hypothetical protein [Rhodococcus globerulus]MDV6267056.1 hypothetical protein [Rhodococcus globerulus]